MTDRRYQRDLNSLVRRKRRQGLDPAKPRSAVPGGQGFSGFGLSPCEQEDVVFGVSDGNGSIWRCDPVNDETEWMAITLGSYICIYKDAYYTAASDSIRLNNVEILTGTHNNIRAISCNNDELWIADYNGTANEYRIRAYDHATLTLQRTKVQDLVTGGSALSLALGQTHYAISQTTATTDQDHIMIYDNDDTLIFHKSDARLDDTYSNHAVAINSNRAYFHAFDGSYNDIVYIYDLAGTLIDTWAMPNNLLSSTRRGMEITSGGIWFSGYNVTESLFTYYARGATADTFDSTRVEFSFAAVEQLDGISRNRCSPE